MNTAQRSVNKLAGLPPAALTAVNAAERAMHAQNIEEAERQLTSALALAPNHPELLHMLGFVYGKRGRYAEAIHLLQQAMVQRPQDPLILVSLGNVLVNAVMPEDAAQAFRRACELDPTLTMAWFNLAIIYKSRGRYGEAIHALKRVIALDPAHENARTILGDVLKDDGRIEEARDTYRDIVTRRPSTGLAWWGLANIKTVPMSQDDVGQIRHALSLGKMTVYSRIAMYFALAKGLEDQRSYPEAFVALQEANALARKVKMGWNAKAFSAKTDSMLSVFPAPAPQADADFGSEAIFIVSMPRSGSTLTEQILASHPQVEGGDELKDLWMVLNEETQRRQCSLSEWATRLDAADWRRLGQNYLERTAHWRAKRPRFTNKLPGNWLFIGAIHAMLPGARVVCCRRDPLETCFACYRQMMDGSEYTHDFGDLGNCWLDFDRSVRHWGTAYPHRVREQVYENLIADPEGQTRALLDFCGLEFDERCMRFYETERRVRTPSGAQVREPLKRDTARTAKYGALLDPLRLALHLPPFAASS